MTFPAITKHTPGEWSIEPHGDGHALYAGRDNEHHGLRLLNISDGDRNIIANCALICAAPDLLACVKDAHAMLRTVEVIDGEDGDPWSTALARMEAAIAKAVQS